MADPFFATPYCKNGTLVHVIPGQFGLRLRRGCGYNRRSEPVYDLLAAGHTALKTISECSFTTRKLRFLDRFCLVWL